MIRIPNLAVALATITVIGACDGHTAIREDRLSDRAAAEAIVERLADAYAAHVQSERPVRVVLGTWNHVAGAGGEWSRRLALAIRDVAEEAAVHSPEAPRLLDFFRVTSGNAEEAHRIVVAVVDREDTDCCVLFAVRVQLTGDRWEIGNAYHAGYGNAISLELVLEKIEEVESPYRADEVVK